MKNVLNVLLILAIAGLAWVSYKSIDGPISFKHTKAERERAIIQQLMDIRTAQVAYKAEHFAHAGTFDELKDWLENGSVTSVYRLMELTEEQLESGMTEEKAVAIVNKAKQTGKWSEAEKAGLSVVKDGVRSSFTRDTIATNAKEKLFGSNYDLSKFGVVPGTDVMFDMDTASVMTASGYDIKIFQANVPYTAYLSDLNEIELANLIDRAKQTNKYPGLKVGSLTEINNNAGNWE